MNRLAVAFQLSGRLERRYEVWEALGAVKEQLYAAEPWLIGFELEAPFDDGFGEIDCGGGGGGGGAGGGDEGGGNVVYFGGNFVGCYAITTRPPAEDGVSLK